MAGLAKGSVALYCIILPRGVELLLFMILCLRFFCAWLIGVFLKMGYCPLVLDVSPNMIVGFIVDIVIMGSQGRLPLQAGYIVVLLVEQKQPSWDTVIQVFGELVVGQ